MAVKFRELIIPIMKVAVKKIIQNFKKTILEKIAKSTTVKFHS